MSELHRSDGSRGSHRLFWASDNRHLAVVESDRTVVVWDTDTDERSTIETPVLTVSLLWSPDHSRVAATGADGTIRVYEVATMRLLASLEGARPPAHEARRDGDSADVVVIEIRVPPDHVRDVIGPKGTVVRSIESDTDTLVRVESDGRVTIEGESEEAVHQAERLVLSIVDPPEVHVGDRFHGRVANITSYGAFVNLVPGRDGLLHVNKLGGGDRRITDVYSVLKTGDQIDVVVENILDNGKISLALG